MDSSTQPLIKHKCFLPALAGFLAFLFLSFHFTATSDREVALLLPSLLEAPEPPPSITANQQNLTQSNAVDIEEGSAEQPAPAPAPTPAPAPAPVPEKIAAPPAAVTAQPPAERMEGEKCDVSVGKWVYDPENYPLYKAKQCPFLSEQVTCRRNGRPDDAYQGWRWEPRGCKIPRFNGTHMLEILRGKRLVIVGDSLNRNQWESLACLLYSSVRSSRAFVRTRHSVRIFRAKDYGCSIEFFWSPFLVRMDVLNDGSKILKLDRLSELARRWQGADIMVFNTGHWWTHHGRMKPWKYFEHRGELVEKMKGFTAFEIGMKTWAHWIDQKVDPTKTTVIFRSFSPVHKKVNLQWCYSQMQPITNETYAQWFPRPMVSIIQKTISEMRTPVTYLNITRMSEYRQDAHTSVYTTRHEKALTKDEKNQPDEFADCDHWCLPGVPDAWNELLYASIIGSPFILL